jgi:hypothetical protein
VSLALLLLGSLFRLLVIPSSVYWCHLTFHELFGVARRGHLRNTSCLLGCSSKIRFRRRILCNAMAGPTVVIASFIIGCRNRRCTFFSIVASLPAFGTRSPGGLEHRTCSRQLRWVSVWTTLVLHPGTPWKVIGSMASFSRGSCGMGATLEFFGISHLSSLINFDNKDEAKTL